MSVSKELSNTQHFPSVLMKGSYSLKCVPLRLLPVLFLVVVITGSVAHDTSALWLPKRDLTKDSTDRHGLHGRKRAHSALSINKNYRQLRGVESERISLLHG